MRKQSQSSLVANIGTHSSSVGSNYVRFGEFNFRRTPNAHWIPLSLLNNSNHHQTRALALPVTTATRRPASQWVVPVCLALDPAEGHQTDDFLHRGVPKNTRENTKTPDAYLFRSSPPARRGGVVGFFKVIIAHLHQPAAQFVRPTALSSSAAVNYSKI